MSKPQVAGERQKTGPKGPTKMTDDVLRKLEEAFAIDATIAEACFYADIAQDTYYRWVKERPELSEKFARLRERPVLLARQSVIKGMEQDPHLALKYLERKRKAEFASRSELTGADGEKIESNTIVFTDFKNDPTGK